MSQSSSQIIAGQTNFDYIIIGAGSAGCVLANRLSAEAAAQVLLLEAGGPDKSTEIKIPAAFNKLFKSSNDWAYLTEPQAHMYERELYWPRGKVLGGSSSINAMIYSRANARDHDRWAGFGVKGWDYDDILPYYKKCEHNERGADEFHGTNGPLNIADLRCVNPLTELFLQAGESVGVPANRDINGVSQVGLGLFQVTQKNGKRHSAADAYLKPALTRSNLQTRTHCHVTRLLFAGERCTGVEYVQAGKLQQVTASREVILSGGAINSPQLLLLSGIGAAAELGKLDISVQVDLPGVGQNLQDHLLIGVEYECTRPVTLYKADGLANVLRWLFLKSGPLTTNVAEAGGFVHSSLANAATTAAQGIPDIELLFAPTFYMNHGMANPEAHGFSIGVALQKPASSGTIQLRSADPFAPPRIQPNYLQAEADLAVAIEGVKLAREILQTKLFDAYRGREHWPGPALTADNALAEHVRRTSDTIYHPIGTCRMGTPADRRAVVDGQLRVLGVTGLRVVDASVIPVQITGHTNAPTLALAEKAADLILKNT